MASTINNVLLDITQGYIDKCDPNNPPEPRVAEAELLELIAAQINTLNQMRDNNNKMRIPQYLNATQIAMLMAAFHPICLIHTGSEEDDLDRDLLAIYQGDGSNKGVYVSTEAVFRQLARQYNFSISSREFEEVLIHLRDFIHRKKVCDKRNYIAVNNGVFDYDTKQLLPFSEDLVFLSKSRVDYNPNAQNIVIHNDKDNTDWDVESWMNEISDDPEIVNLLWEIIGATIRPLVHWDKAAFFYSESGSNGKGTLCQLMRNICGFGNHASLSLEDMSKDFRLEGLLNASCIITDENNVGTFIDKAANLKTLITNDVLQINRKHKAVVSYRYRGFMIQCLNELPRIRDKSDSFYRRQLFVPFNKSFTGIERKYIKDDYLQRKEVLEYVLYRVLNMNYYELSEPDACAMVLEDYKEYNDPVRQFINDVLPLANWDVLPFNFLYDAYKEWFKQNMPSGKIQNNSTFKMELIAAIAKNPEWTCEDKNQRYKASTYMVGYEPIVHEFNLIDWMNPKYANIAAATPEQKCTAIKEQWNGRTVKGIIRLPHSTHVTIRPNDNPDNNSDKEA